MRSRSRRRSGLILTAVALSISCGDDDAPARDPAPPAAAPPSDAPLLAEQGELAPTDAQDARGRYDRFFVNVREGDRLLVTLRSSAFDPILEVTPPARGALVNDDWEGDRTRSQLELIAEQAGAMKVEVRSYAPDGHGAYALEVRRASDERSGAGVSVLSAGRAVDGELAEGDHALSRGDLFDAFVIRADGPVRVTVGARGGASPRSSLVGPDGLALIAADGRYEAPSAGTYRLQVIGPRGTGYRVAVERADADEAPLFARAHHQFNRILGQLAGTDLAPPPGRDDPAPSAPGTAPPTPAVASALPVRVGDRLRGNLAPNDARLPSGEHFDVYELAVAQPAGEVAIDMQSSTLDTFLRVDGPDGQHWENDDHGGTLSSRVVLALGTPGTYRVTATSYRPGATGPYELAVTSQPASGATSVAAGPGQQLDGELREGDARLASGEYSDEHRFEWTVGARVHIEAQSNDFDSYLIVHPPSGPQRDNDDMTPGQSLNAGMDLQVTESGTWRVLVTSYQPGETGRYRLVVTEGASVLDPPPRPADPVGDGGGDAPPSAAGGRVWGLFAGITDYPGSTNDLPECANDARKLAEAVRNQGNMPPDQEFLFTDAQATLANIRQAMQTIGQRIRPDDVLVFFYSGHGGQTDTSQDEDELDGRDEYLFVYDGNLMDDELGRLFDGIRARVALVAIDSCFAGGFAKDVITRPGRVGMFSSEEDVTSAVADRFRAGGYLSHFLRLGIQGEADNDPHDSTLTVGELTHYTWRQFGQHASDVRMSMGYQHLVVDRGAVPTTELLWAVRR